MKYLKAYDTDTERSADLINMPLPYVTYARDTEEVFADGGYIRDGLVFQLDGIQKGPNANAWTDLVGGHVFEKNSSAVTSDDKSFIFTGASGCWLRNADILNIHYNTHTIEICYNATNTSATQAMLFMTKTNYNLCFAYYQTTKATTATYSSSIAKCIHSFSNSLIGKKTVSVNSTCALANITDTRSALNNGYWGANSSYNTIGSRQSNNVPFTGNIYAIRIYNRHLTIDEMRHNQQLDVKRFLS